MHLRNPNLGPNSGKQILEARILDPNSWVEFFILFFQQRKAPRKFTLKKFTSQNSPSKIQPRIAKKYSHCTSAGPFARRVAIRLPFLSRYFFKSMPSWQKVVYTPPICIAIRLPFVSRYLCRSIRVRGRWDTPKFG